MAKSFCRVEMLGNVGKDPEVRSTPGGTTVANLSVATSYRVKDAQGNWTDKTEWVNLVAFARTAEIIRDYVHKGSKLYVEGRLQTSSWDDKASGQKRYKTEVVVNDLTLLSGRDEGVGRGEGGSGGHSNPRSSSSYSTASSNDYADQGISDEDIPF
jgi:single-strand DNA-binding protein